MNEEITTAAAAAIGIIIFVVILALVSPFVTIVALNTLGLSIPFTFKTWLAIFWLHIVAASSRVSS